VPDEKNSTAYIADLGQPVQVALQRLRNKAINKHVHTLTQALAHPLDRMSSCDMTVSQEIPCLL